MAGDVMYLSGPVMPLPMFAAQSNARPSGAVAPSAFIAPDRYVPSFLSTPTTYAPAATYAPSFANTPPAWQLPPPPSALPYPIPVAPLQGDRGDVDAWQGQLVNELTQLQANADAARLAASPTWRAAAATQQIDALAQNAYPQAYAPAATYTPAQPAAGLAKPRVLWMPSPSFDDRPDDVAIDAIVLHHTGAGGSAQSTARYLQDPGNEASSHYVVGKDGAIVQTVPDDERAWHAGTSSLGGRTNVNDFSLGIELVNQGDGRDPYPDAQYQAVAHLVAWMVQTYNVPLARIVGQGEVRPGARANPSANFDWDRVAAIVNRDLGL